MARAVTGADIGTQSRWLGEGDVWCFYSLHGDLSLWSDKIVKWSSIYCFTVGLTPAWSQAASQGSGCTCLSRACFLSSSPWMPQAQCLCPVCMYPVPFPGLENACSEKPEVKPGGRSSEEERREQRWMVHSELGEPKVPAAILLGADLSLDGALHTFRGGSAFDR